MSPGAKFHGVHEQSKNVINDGPRPSPLMINIDSHLIRKPSSSSISVPSETKPHRQQRRKPIIIYTHSPRIIHTEPRDFMALVQKLTGTSRTDDEVSAATASLLHQPKLEASENWVSSSKNSIKQQPQQQWKQGVCDHDETSSALRDVETCVKGGENVRFSVSNLGFADMPLFTPHSSDFFCSSQLVNKYSDSPYAIMDSLKSPSGLEFIQELPEY